jgi:hypothetical protein
MVIPQTDMPTATGSLLTYTCQTEVDVNRSPYDRYWFVADCGFRVSNDRNWPIAPAHAWRQKAVVGRMSGLRMSAIWNPSQEAARGQLRALALHCNRPDERLQHP